MSDEPEEVSMRKFFAGAMLLVGSQIGVAVLLGDPIEEGMVFGAIGVVLFTVWLVWSDSVVLGPTLNDPRATDSDQR